MTKLTATVLIALCACTRTPPASERTSNADSATNAESISNADSTRGDGAAATSFAAAQPEEYHDAARRSAF
jgi:hypothetical protein